MTDPIVLVLYILIGAIAGMIYGLRRIFILERKINALEKMLVAKFGLKPVKKKK